MSHSVAALTGCREGKNLQQKVKFVATICVAFVLSGCLESGSSTRMSLSDKARQICVKNGYKLGTVGFNNCFSATLQAASAKDAEDAKMRREMFRKGMEMATAAPRPVGGWVYAPQQCYWNGYRNVCR